MRNRLALAILMAFAISVQGGQLAPPYQVANVNTTPDATLLGVGSRPVAAGDDVYFLSWDGLWRTDGTNRGTYFVAQGAITPPFVFGGRMFYTSSTPVPNQHEVWVTDGTTPGTLKLADGPLVSYSPCAGALCFSTGGTALRITDGTPAGTRVVKHTAPDLPGANLTLDFETLNGQLYFNAYDTAHGDCGDVGLGIVICGELWTSDGTAEGTRLAIDVNPGPQPSAPRNLFAHGDTLYFNAMTFRDNQLPSRCPYATEGTGATLRRLSEDCPSYVSGMYSFRVLGSRVHYEANGKLWTTDGTPEGTRTLDTLLQVGTDARPRAVAEAANKLVLLVHRPGQAGTQVWSSNFDFTGAAHLFDLRSGDVVGQGRNGRVLLTNRLEDNSLELWETDGTASGSRRIHSGGRADAYVDPAKTSRFDFFTAFRLPLPRLWRTDGTEQGTQSIDGFPTPRDAGSTPKSLTPAGNQLFFVASSGQGERGLYATTATPGSFRRLLDCANCSDFTASGARLHFQKGEAAWTSDGTAAGTVPFAQWAGADVHPWTTPMEVGGRLLFAGRNASGAAVFAGTAGSVTAVAPLPGTGARVSHTVIGNRLVFGWSGGVWSSDGTAAGTGQISIGAPQSPFTTAGSRAFYTISDTIWVTDGTAEGTRAVIQKSPRFLAGRQGLLYFIYTNDGSLWRTDGTAEGTFELSPSIAPGFEFAIDAGPHLALLTYRQSQRLQIWTSDGTRAGTVLRREVTTPGFHETREPFIGPDGNAYAAHAAVDSVHLINLSGGPDLSSSFPEIEPLVDGLIHPGRIQLAVTSDALYFGASSQPHGTELWAMRLDGVTHYAPAALRVENAMLTELSDGRRVAVFRVQMTGVPEGPLATVSFATSDGSAIAGRDYTAAAGTLRFGDLVTVKSVVVPVSETGTGTFWLTLSDANGATLERAVAMAVTKQPERRRVVRR